MDTQTKLDIKLLINVARPEITAADKERNIDVLNWARLKYGYIAHRVYLALDKPHRSNNLYHEEPAQRVLLDPWTVFNRAHSCGIRETRATPDCAEFWDHPDMIQTLIDHLVLNYSKEEAYASA